MCAAGAPDGMWGWVPVQGSSCSMGRSAPTHPPHPPTLLPPQTWLCTHHRLHITALTVVDKRLMGPPMQQQAARPLFAPSHVPSLLDDATSHVTQHTHACAGICAVLLRGLLHMAGLAAMGLGRRPPRSHR